nr:Hypothetical protein FSTVLC9_356 [Faustovirus]
MNTNKSRNVFEQATRMQAPDANNKADNLIFNKFINGNIPAFHDANKSFKRLVVIGTTPFENGVLACVVDNKFLPMCEEAVDGFDFNKHGHALAHLLRDDVEFVTSLLARMFVKLSGNTIQFQKIYDEISALNIEDDGANYHRLVLNTTLAQRDDTVYYFTRFSMRLYNWLLTINDGVTQKRGINPVVASKLMWLDRGVLFKDLMRSDRDHYLWFNSAFQWFCSEHVSRFRGAAPDVEKLNEFSEAIYLNSVKSSSTPTVPEQMLSGEKYIKYMRQCILVVSILAQIHKTHPGWSKWLQTQCRANHCRLSPFRIAYDSAKIMVDFYNEKITALGNEKILTDVFVDY